MYFLLLCISSTKSQEMKTPFFFLRMQNMTGFWPKSGCAPVTSTSTRLSPTFCAHIWCLKFLASPCTASCLLCIPFLRYSKWGKSIWIGRGQDGWGGAMTSSQDYGWEWPAERPLERCFWTVMPADSPLVPEDTVPGD